MTVAAVILGGIGIFLVGMILLTEGLKAAAGDSLRSGLQRFARTPARGVASGTVVTALVQSSSATTLTTIGFVSAGLLTFPQALGVIFGANLGTTSTGWIVSVLGLRVSVGAMALPLVGIGALLRLLGSGRWAHAGMALVGFGLIFVGIDTLQEGMEGLAERIDPATFPGATLGGRIVLLGIGFAMTVVMQSSSAAVATTLTALHSGTIGLEQAALLVVGQNLGTTVKAALAAIGGTVAVKRTAAAHILFNTITAVLGLVLLQLLLGVSLAITGPDDPAITIALFHSIFNVLGVVVLFPFIVPFAARIERWMPERELRLTRYLDSTLVELPSVAVEAARRAGIATAQELFRQAVPILQGAPKAAPEPAFLEGAGEAVIRLRAFLSGVRTPAGEEEQFARHLSVLHAADHLDRLRRALEEPVPIDPRWGTKVARILEEWAEEANPDAGHTAPEAPLRKRAGKLAEVRKRRRARILEKGVYKEMDPVRLRREVDGLLRLDRIGYHAFRAAHHLQLAGPDDQELDSSADEPTDPSNYPEPPEEPPATDPAEPPVAKPMEPEMAVAEPGAREGAGHGQATDTKSDR